MSNARLLVALNGSPVQGSSVDLLLGSLCGGAAAAGGRSLHVRCNDLAVKPCQACGPDPTSGYCIFHDDMDQMYEALRDAHAVVVGTPVYFDTVSAQLKLVMDRCNCITPLVRLPAAGFGFRPLWPRTRRAAFVVVCGQRNRWDMAERSVRGFLKWVGARWEETLVFSHGDCDAGSVARHPELLARARELGRRLIADAPLETPQA